MVFLQLFWVFLKIGLFSFGGGYGMIPVMKQEVVSLGWLTESEFLDIIGLSESTPGPIAVNLATYVGAYMGGFWGSILATFAVVLPAFLIMFFIVKILQKFSDNKYVSSFLSGVKPVVVGLILAVGITLILKSMKVLANNAISFLQIDYKSLIISAIIAIIIVAPKFFKKKTPPALTILISAVLGMVIYAI